MIFIKSRTTHSVVRFFVVSCNFGRVVLKFADDCISQRWFCIDYGRFFSCTIPLHVKICQQFGKKTRKSYKKPCAKYLLRSYDFSQRWPVYGWCHQRNQSCWPEYRLCHQRNQSCWPEYRLCHQRNNSCHQCNNSMQS